MFNVSPRVIKDLVFLFLQPEAKVGTKIPASPENSPHARNTWAGRDGRRRGRVLRDAISERSAIQ